MTRLRRVVVVRATKSLHSLSTVYIGGAMRLVVARCSVDYSGRLSAHLPLATRLLMIKADGTILIHADTGSKALNWMSPPCSLVEGEQAWTVSNKAGEQLLITIEEMLSDQRLELGLEPGLAKDGVEAHLQRLLADRCELLGTGWTLVRREFPTDIGPVDLLCRDGDGCHVAVEVKRHAEIDGVEQLTRYLQRLEPVLGQVRGVLAAQSFKPQARVLAADRGIVCIQLDYDELRGLEGETPTLF